MITKHLKNLVNVLLSFQVNPKIRKHVKTSIKEMFKDRNVVNNVHVDRSSLKAP